MQSTRPSQQELRSSFILPIAITLAIWAVGIVVFVLFPTYFNEIISLLIGLSLFIYLWRWTRRATMLLRITAVLFAIPTLIGITFGLTRGKVSYTLIGFAISFVLLMIQRSFDTPLSYRAATRQFRQGNDDEALSLLSKAITARPDFWQSHQLRALIYLMQGHLRHAQRDGEAAVALNPMAHEAHNILGQVYLAQTDFEKAVAEYETAVSLAPKTELYVYYLGMALYRNGRYPQAAEALAIATQGSLPNDSYDLLAHFYLGRALAANGEEALAAEAYKMMDKFKDGLPELEKQYAEQPPYPHLAQMKEDLVTLATVLPEFSSSDN
jgi:tetratricopeptide (TPR) repeat protein